MNPPPVPSIAFRPPRSLMRDAVRGASTIRDSTGPRSLLARDPDILDDISFYKTSSIRRPTARPSKALPTRRVPSPVVESPTREWAASKNDFPPFARTPSPIPRISPPTCPPSPAPSIPEPCLPVSPLKHPSLPPPVFTGSDNKQAEVSSPTVAVASAKQHKPVEDDSFLSPSTPAAHTPPPPPPPSPLPPFFVAPPPASTPTLLGVSPAPQTKPHPQRQQTFSEDFPIPFPSMVPGYDVGSEQQDESADLPTVSNSDTDLKASIGVVIPLPPFERVIRPSRAGMDNDSPFSSPRSPKGSYISSTSTHVASLSPLGDIWPATSSAWGPQPPSDSRLDELGWTEYHLPDGSMYFFHRMRRITTDINLRDDRVLDAVAAFLDRPSSAVPFGKELWIKEGSVTKKGLVSTNFFVDHAKRTVVSDQEKKGGKKNISDHDHSKSMECKYWSFLESHPAHAPLPPTATAEAFDVLAWGWTDRSLSSHRTIPFPREECQELMSLLRSFSGEDESGFQLVLHSRLVAQIHLRLAQWHQQSFHAKRQHSAGNHDVKRDSSPLLRMALGLFTSRQTKSKSWRSVWT